MPQLHVLRVFCDDDGQGGNALGVFLEGAGVPPAKRQEVARRLGFSETVFVDDRASGEIAIFTPGSELDFAGHPTVGTAWLLAREGTPVEVLRPPAGRCPHAPRTSAPSWLPGRAGPPFELRELDSAGAVDRLDGPPDGRDLIDAWAWIDEHAGLVRARVFVDLHGIPEDEATGSAATKLAAETGRPIEIHQGRGSVIAARPVGDGMVEIGGRVVLDEVREDPG